MAQTSQSNPAIGGAVPTQFYPTPEKVVDFIATLIRAPAGYYYRNREVIRILDPCCGAGEADQIRQALSGKLARSPRSPSEKHGWRVFGGMMGPAQ